MGQVKPLAHREQGRCLELVILGVSLVASPRCVRASHKGVLSAPRVPPCLSLAAPRSVGTRQESGALRRLYAEITLKAEDDFVKTWQENQANKNMPEKKAKVLKLLFFLLLSDTFVTCLSGRAFHTKPHVQACVLAPGVVGREQSLEKTPE